MVDSISEFDLFEQGHGSVVKFAGCLTVEQAGEHDVGEGIHGGDKIEFLKDDSDLRSSVSGEVFFIHGMDRVAVDNDFAGVRSIESGKEVEEGAFSGAGWAHDCEKAGFVDCEGGTAKGVDASVDFR